MIEKTLVLIKPDALANGYEREVLHCFLVRGFSWVGSRLVQPTADLVERHYQEKFRQRPEIRDGVVAYLTSGIVWALVFERPQAVAEAREILFVLREQFHADALHTLFHASDSPEAAEREIALWFPKIDTNAKKEALHAHTEE